MAKSNLLVEGRVYCPHCRVPIGKLAEGLLPVGFVSLPGNLSSTVVCNDCGKTFTYRPPQQKTADGRDQMPPRGLSQPL